MPSRIIIDRSVWGRGALAGATLAVVSWSCVHISPRPSTAPMSEPGLVGGLRQVVDAMIGATSAVSLASQLGTEVSDLGAGFQVRFHPHDGHFSDGEVVRRAGGDMPNHVALVLSSDAPTVETLISLLGAPREVPRIHPGEPRRLLFALSRGASLIVEVGADDAVLPRFTLRRDAP
jgi:hypothetical protein